MTNTVTQRTLFGDGTTKKVVRHIHLLSDGLEETDLVVYDNSAFIADSSKGNLIKVTASGSADTLVRLEWDQSTDSPAIAVNPSNSVELDFRTFGGIRNPNGTGATGDLLLSTANLSNLDEFTLILEIDQTQI